MGTLPKGLVLKRGSAALVRRFILTGYPCDLILARYIVLNPVRAHMTARVEDWPCSSYAATAGKGEAPDWLESAWLVQQFGADPVAARAAYRRFVRAGIGGASPWEDLRGQVYLGAEKFLERMEKLAAARASHGLIADRRGPARRPCWRKLPRPLA